LGYLLTEMKVLDTCIKGGECASFKTDYVWQAALSPIKVWKHDGSGEVFMYRADDGASAYLKRNDAYTLFKAFSALRASAEPRNADRAGTSTFMSRSMTTTRAGRIV
jgi:hypothetical protein